MAIAKLINELALNSNGDLVTSGGPLIPIAPSDERRAIRVDWRHSFDAD